VLEAVRGLGPTQIRYPGGNFVSGYHWRDGVGSRDARPVRFDHVWKTIESNQMGSHEFIAYCRMVDTLPHLCVNLGNGTPEEAADWVEYCNATHDTTLTRLRATNGSPQPFAVPFWSLGNEMYGSWQVGHKSAAAYAEVALEAALRMREVDPSIALIACGFENSQRWNATVLDVLAREVDYLSLHLYFAHTDYLTALAQPLLIEQVCRWHAALARLVCREQGLAKRIPIAFDEWNVAYPPGADNTYVYTLTDALAAACGLNALLRCADVVALANVAQMVNVIAPIRATPHGVVRQTTYWPLALYGRLAGATALRAAVHCETYQARYVFHDAAVPREGFHLPLELYDWPIDDEVPYLDVSAALAADGRTLTLAVVNRHPEAPIDAEIRLVGARPAAVARVEQVTGTDARARNTAEQPDLVRVTRATWSPDPAHPTFAFPPRALTMLHVVLG
jgi:alpha-N-arabinofuranosidase